MPYLPVFYVLAAVTLNKLYKNKIMRNFLLISMCLIALITILYRLAANVKYLPVILGWETRDVFLAKNLNYEFGDFYDVDGYFKTHIKSSDKVLTSGIHNLYYIDFPFVDISWYKKGDFVNYLLVRGQTPTGFNLSHLVYENQTTHVKLYKL